MSGRDWADGRRVWIGGVKKGCAEARLRRHFEHYGTIVECETGFTGIAFIVFESAAAATRMCKELNGTTNFENRTCTVKMASDKGYAEAIRRRTAEEAGRQAVAANYPNGQYSDAKSKRGNNQQAYQAMRVPPPPPPPPPGRRTVRRGVGMGPGPQRKRRRRWVETNSQREVADRSMDEDQHDDDEKDAEDAGSSPGRATRADESQSAMRPSPTPHGARRWKCRSKSQESRRRSSSASRSRSPFSRRRASSVGSATRVSRVTRSNSSRSASSFDGVRGAAAKAAVFLANSLPLEKATQQEPSPEEAAAPAAPGGAAESTEAGTAAAASEQAPAASDGAAPQAQTKEPKSPAAGRKSRDTAQSPQASSPTPRHGKSRDTTRQAAPANGKASPPTLALPAPPPPIPPAPAEAVSPKPVCKHEEATASVMAVASAMANIFVRDAAGMGTPPARGEPAVAAKACKEEVHMYTPVPAPVPVVTVEPVLAPGMIVEAGKHAGSIWHAAGENVPPPVIAAGGDLVDICLIHKGNKKLVTHLSTTKVREIIELQPALVQALKKPVVALDARGFEVGKDIPVGFLMHRADVGDDGVRLLELTLEADKWAE